jgi:hypothetical protein
MRDNMTKEIKKINKKVDDIWAKFFTTDAEMPVRESKDSSKKRVIDDVPQDALPQSNIMAEIAEADKKSENAKEGEISVAAEVAPAAEEMEKESEKNDETQKIDENQEPEKVDEKEVE